MALYEISKERHLECVRQYYYRGRRTFITTDPTGDVGDTIGNDFPGSFPAPSGNDSTPICSRARVIWNPGNPPTNQQLLVADYESPGIGFYRYSTQSVSERVKKYYGVKADNSSGEGNPAYLIEGREADGIHEWQCVSGNNVTYESYVRVRIDTSYATASVPYTDFNTLADTVNNATFLGAAAGSLWFRHVVTAAGRVAGVTDAAIFMDWRRAGTLWNERCLTRRGVWVTEEHNVFDGIWATDDIRRRVVFKPGTQITGTGIYAGLEDSAAPVVRKVIVTGDFSVLGISAMTAW